MPARSIAVFCGSAHGVDPRHANDAREVGREIARRGWTLVYGGGRVGLMGEVADAALGAGAPVLGVITRFLYEWEVGHDGLTDLEIGVPKPNSFSRFVPFRQALPPLRPGTHRRAGRPG